MKSYELINLDKLLDNINEVVNHIINIINKYVFALKEEEKIVRIDEKYKYDVNLLKRTLKDPKLYIRDNGEIKLAKIYSYDLIDNLDTYENRFIKYLIKQILINLNILEGIYKNINISNALKGKLDFSYFGNFNNLNTLKALDLKYINNNIRKIADINILFNQIKNSNYYKNIKDEVFNEILLTNIFISDKDYNYCYKFYLNKEDYFIKFKELFINDLLSNNDVINNNKNEIKLKNNNFIIDIKIINKTINLNIENNNINHNYKLNIANTFLPVLNITGDIISNVPLINIKSYNDIFKTFIYLVEEDGDNCPYCSNTLEEDSCSNCGLKFNKIKINNKNYLWLYNLLALPLGGE